MTDTTTVLGIPHADPSYPRPVDRSATFPTLESAIEFAKRNKARLFYLRDGVWAFQNYGKLNPDQIVD